MTAVANGMSYLRVSNREEDSMNQEPSLSGKDIVGIIFPPPDIRSIVDKTATFVAKNGVEFENKIKEKEALNNKFAFLSPNDPYNAYYRHKVREMEAGVPVVVPPIVGLGQLPPQAPEAVQELMREKEFVPKEVPKNFEYMADPSTINGFDLDVLRLTALFVARNGRQFLTQLMQKEIRNFQFDFLKPQHSNFPYFTKLVEQYTKVILPPTDVNVELAKTSGFDDMLKDAKYRVAWEKHQKAIKDKAEEESERERIAYAQIEWHDFVVVQTVDYQPSETSNLPPLCTPRDVGTRILLQQREEAKAATEVVEMEMDSDSEDEEEDDEEDAKRDEDGFVVPKPKPRGSYQMHQPTPNDEISEDVIVRDYDPKRARQQKQQIPDHYIISPLTNEKIPAAKLEEHIRYNTVDPQYKIQRDREIMDRRDEDATNASGTEISRNIGKLAERRTDIFGVGEKGAEQTAIGKKLGEEEQRPKNDNKNIWDGQQSTIDATTRAAQQEVQQQQQQALASERSNLPPPPPPVPTTHVAKLLMVPPGMPLATPLMGMPGGVPFMPPHAPYGAAGVRMIVPPHVNDMLNHPPAKRARVEDDLVSEELWIQKFGKNLRIYVSLPNAAEWNCDGRQEEIDIEMTCTVGDLKTRIQDRSTIPASKQKLSYESMFLNNNNTLAYYNVNQNAQIVCQLKERGGRKK